MSTFEDDRYQWRETYFVLFDPTKRPLLHEIRRGLGMFKSFQVREALADEQGRIESLSVASYDDFAAIDLIYQCGAHVLAETETILEQMNFSAFSKNRAGIEKIRKCQARLDILHFEQMEPIKHPEPREKPVSVFSKFSQGNTTPPVKNPFVGRPKFQFDQNRYIPPPEIDSIASDDSETNPALGDDYDQEGQMDPNTLILVLELLCRLTDGIAIDTASGIFITSD